MTQKLQAHAGPEVSSMDLHQSGNALLSTGRDGTLRVWDLSRGQQAASRPLTEAGGSTAAEGRDRQLGGAGRRLSAGQRPTQSPSTASAGRETQRISSPSRLLAALYLQQGLVVGACEDGTVRVWSVQQGGQQTGGGPARCPECAVWTCLRVSGSALVVSASTDGQVLAVAADCRRRAAAAGRERGAACASPASAWGGDGTRGGREQQEGGIGAQGAAGGGLAAGWTRGR